MKQANPRIRKAPRIHPWKPRPCRLKLPITPMNPDWLLPVERFAGWLQAAREAPASERIVCVQNGIHVYTPYEEDFISCLKDLIPYSDRAWIPATGVSASERGYWWVSNKYAEQARMLFDIFFPVEVDSDLPEE